MLNVKLLLDTRRVMQDLAALAPRRAWGMWGGLNEDEEYHICIVME